MTSKKQLHALPSVRLDKWLWCARLFKTRTLAAAAVNGGRVRLNENRVKPAHSLRPGDVLAITRDLEHIQLVVKALAVRRGSAAEAQGLYAETADSLAGRQRLAALQRIRALVNPAPARRPDKRSRRQIIRFVKSRASGDR